ncbi:MAG: DUF1501 domain-containing protein, partial [Planctomycetes bacterium]|nr:DUF1501 domain-containing protein [Planctomycetota bacterium]
MSNINVHRYTRRGMLHVGALGAAGMALPQLLVSDALASNRLRGAAKSCILFFLEGGPSHIDLWDMKPGAPAEVRGEFRPISTSLSGVHVCEHLPMMARQMHQLAQIRSVHHKVNDHNAGAYYAMTGRSPVKANGLIVRDEPDNFPPLGSVMAKLRPLKSLPPFVQLPDVMFNNGADLPGQRAGMLGSAFDPLVAGDPSARRYQIPGLTLLKDVSLDRLDKRRSLLGELNQTAVGGAEGLDFAQFQQQAVDLLGSPAARRAFDVRRESAKTRARYGLPDRVDRSVEARKFGGLPHLGQCMLMARRLIEAGVRLVTVCTGRRIDQTWDTHRDHFPLLKRSILPYVDRAFSALLEDMDERGLLDETLVVAMGEFGRTPKLGQITSGAGADKAGRDHWPDCYTVM